MKKLFLLSSSGDLSAGKQIRSYLVIQVLIYMLSNNSFFFTFDLKIISMFLELLKTITQRLEQKEIRYMVSGSLAINVYSVPRMTLDIDIVIELNETNFMTFLEIFKSGYYINEETALKEIRRKGMFNVIDHDTGLKIDFIIRKDTEYRRLEFSRKTRKMIKNVPVWMVSAEDLVISKLEWIQQLQSDRQMHDIKNLMALPDLDKEYISSWCRKLNLDTFNMI